MANEADTLGYNDGLQHMVGTPLYNLSSSQQGLIIVITRDLEFATPCPADRRVQLLSTNKTICFRKQQQKPGGRRCTAVPRGPQPADDDVYYCICWRLKLEGETENMGVFAAGLNPKPST